MSTVLNSTRQWQDEDRDHHLHPFTDINVLKKKGARMITRGEGVYLWDSEGEKIIDGMAGLWCVGLGYGRKELSAAAARQMDQLAYYNTFFQTSTMPATELSGLLAEVTPEGFNHVFYGCSGSESNDTVVRLVWRYWDMRGKPGKKTIIGRINGYHGSTLAGASLGGMGFMHAQGPLPLPGFVHIEQPHWYVNGGDLSPAEYGLKAARALEEKIAELGAETIGAFIGEPIQGAGGVIVPPETYWPEIERICRANDILLISDEVICGFGRTGNWFGCETFGFEPDIMTMAKGMSSGYAPISGVMVKDHIVETIGDGGEFAHGYTYSGHPVSCAVALANITILKDEKIIDIVRTDTGPYFQKRLGEFADHPLIGEVRGKGLVGAVQIARDKKSRALFDDVGRVGGICRDHCFENGLIMRASGDSMLLSPPLVVTRAEIDEMMDKARMCLDLTARDVGLS
ncbi:aspartate aminotransferase family protein [Varunaivibrio sulfuroxidans]|uniref:Putrescine aminotransferase n=1 Tax=Varunaivibrio sulfuroxidans TaxID=1773489 RepID=A0A4R3JDD4_9PROT|nr:aspartate aminotransferase family protein [Varunaivibrio sulfuroxidans]TCS63415.1 putrescine aminotransferase [Varunaivibrio sulfuroxidans]WES30439.1 aspartate aminotransferase family protein [Varunaivibrio sulfuroxidans]